MTLKQNDQVYFWAKTTQDNNLGISVENHMQIVGSIATEIAKLYPSILEKYSIKSEQIGFIASLHDIGKISPGFQRKSQKWLEIHNLVKSDQNYDWKATTEPNHSKVTQDVLSQLLFSDTHEKETSSFISMLLGAHHGRITETPNICERDNLHSESISGIDWEAERIKVYHSLVKRFNTTLSRLNINDDSPLLWWIAGIVTISDWIGSDENYFQNTMDDCYDKNINSVQKVVDHIGFKTPEIKKDLSFTDIFPFSPNELQIKAEQIIQAPGIYVIEAPMGIGKTEAAFWASYKLLEKGLVNGIYFALPTQITSNRIHHRMDSFLEKILFHKNRTMLIHSNSWLLNLETEFNPSKTIPEDYQSSSLHGFGADARSGYDWFVSSKRSLIAPFGVGTVDQSLMGVIGVKHFFVRRFALAQKVVIIDEVHSYDIYTGSLIDELAQVLVSLQCVVIILSATLSGRRRNTILKMESEDLPLKEQIELPYPMITQKNISGITSATPVDTTTSKNVSVCFMDDRSAQSLSIDLAENRKGLVLWIADTVKSAQKTYKKLRDAKNQNPNLAFDIGLLHSRFPFWKREELENIWMGKFGKDRKIKNGAILVSTQIVEQSVDLDADLIISELAPTDMLLQRMGRMWRHTRINRPIPKPEFIILKEKHSIDQYLSMSSMDIKKSIGDKGYVYKPFVLLRTLSLWRDIHSINLPKDIRYLIEHTYSELDDMPESWQELFDEMWVKDTVYQRQVDSAKNLYTEFLSDQTTQKTRLSTYETIPLMLFQSLKKKEMVFLDNTKMCIDDRTNKLDVSRSIHKNLVNIPLKGVHIKENHLATRLIEKYFYGPFVIGIVDPSSGQIEIMNGSSEKSIHWSEEYGIQLEDVKSGG